VERVEGQDTRPHRDDRLRVLVKGLPTLEADRLMKRLVISGLAALALLGVVPVIPA